MSDRIATHPFATLLALPLLLFATLATSTHAQTSGLIGTITGPDGSPVPRAVVEVPDLGRSALTDADGEYQIEDLPVGPVSIRVERIGYEVTTRTGTIREGEPTRLDVRLGTRPIELRELVATGTNRATDPLTTVSEIDAVSGVTLSRTGGASLGRTLELNVPGIDNISTGSQVGKPVLRGLSGTRVRLLQDGIAQDYFQYGVRHAPPTSLSQAKRVEVVRGASSVLYGSDAIGGAINMISRDLPEHGDDLHIGGDLDLEAHSNNEEYAGALDLHLSDGAFGARAGFERRDAGNYTTPEARTFFDDGAATGRFGDPKYAGEIPFTDFEQTSWWAQIGVRGDAGTVQLLANRWTNEQNFLLPPGGPAGSTSNPPVGLGQNLEQTNVTLEATSELAGLELRPTLGFQRAIRQAAGPGNPIETDPDFGVDLAKDSWTGRLEARHSGGTPLEGTLGIELNVQDTERRGPVELEPTSDITNFAVFAFEELPLERLTLSSGLRLDIRTLEAVPNERASDAALLENDYTEVSGNVGANLRLTDGVALATNLGTGFRAPTIFELYANGVHGGVAAFQRGTPTLDPERSWNGELSLRLQTDRVRGRVTGYVNRIDDYIYLANTGESNDGGLPIFESAQTDAVIRGVEANAEVGLTDVLDIGAEAAFLSHEGEGLPDPDGEEVDGPLPLIPPNRAGVFVRLSGDRLGFLTGPRLRVDVDHAFDKDAAGRIEPFSQFDAAPFGTASTEAFTIVSLSGTGVVEVGGSTLSLSVAVDNLTDEVYRDFLDTYKGYALSPGRNIRVTLGAPLEFTR